MQFIHMADMHFDAPFTALNNKIGLGDKRRIEQREIFKKIIDWIKKEKISYFFIAGDLYEQEYIKQTTIEYINNLFKSIPNTQIFISPGNHDPFLKNSYYNQFLWSSNVHIFGKNIEVYRYPEVDIYGYGFCDFYCSELEIKNIKIEDKNKINIFITHGCLDASQTLEKQYNPIKKKELESLGFSYVALGHIHKTNYEIEEKIIYPGSPISFGFDELGEHGIIMGKIEKTEKKIDFIKLDEREFVEIQLDISDIYSKEELIEKINQICLEERNFYKLILIGERNFEININSILKLVQIENIIKIKNNTKLSIDIEKLAQEENLKGIFLQQLLKKEYKSEEEQQIIENAIEIGCDII